MWKEIYGFPHYEVNEEGRVRSKDRYIYNKSPQGKEVKVLRKGKILDGGIDSDGYRIVLLYYSSGGGRYTAKVHRLVAEAFIPNPEGKLEVNHKDSNRQNNHWTNLEWVTSAENLDHAMRKGKRHKRAVVQIDIETGNIIKEFESAYVVRDDGFDNGHVHEVCRGKRRSHKGYAWKFKENV